MLKFPRKPKTLFGRLMLSHLLIVALSLIVIGIFLTYLIEDYFFSAREWELAAQAQDAAYLIGEDLIENDLEGVKKTAETLAYSMNAKIRVLNYNRTNLLTFDPEQPENDGGPEEGEGIGLEEREIEHIFKGNMLSKKVYGPVLQRLLVAAPVTYEDLGLEIENEDQEQPAVIGAVTLSVPLRGIEETIAHISRLVLYSGAVGVVFAALLSFSLSKTLTRPLQKINRAALDMAAGNFKYKIEEERDDEIGGLIKTFNYSVEQGEKYLEEQKRLEMLRRNLVANVSHELKAPLASVRGYSELMLDGHIPEHNKEKYLKTILDNTVHLSRLVDDLLTLSHLESGQLSLERRAISVGDLARWSVESVAPRGEAKGVKLSLELEPSLPVIYADRHRLHEVLVNLLDNAIEYTDSGGVVVLMVRARNSQLIIEVKDTGRGIPEEELPFIFERFYKVDKSRRRSEKGSGLGLAIAKELVELHSGEIEVESKVGEGSIFRIYLPLER